jgi:hypothetical protein
MRRYVQRLEDNIMPATRTYISGATAAGNIPWKSGVRRICGLMMRHYLPE